MRWLVMVWLMVAGCVPLPEVEFNARAQGREGAMFLPLMISAPNKLGLAGCNGRVRELGGSWCYSWVPEPGIEVGIETVPMIWGRNDMTATVSSGEWLMGFNEPDLAGQANLLPVEAAVLWREIEQRWPDKRLVAPAPSHLHPEWIAGFYAAYVTAYGQPPRMDALAYHCYFRYANQCIALGERFLAWAEAWGVPEVWCTEFAFLPETNPQAQQQITTFVTWLEQTASITRYAPYVSHEACDGVFWDCEASGDPSLFDWAGRLTEIGTWYARSVW